VRRDAIKAHSVSGIAQARADSHVLPRGCTFVPDVRLATGVAHGRVAGTFDLFGHFSASLSLKFFQKVEMARLQQRAPRLLR